MFTNFARAAVWGSSWFFNPEIETNPLMMVTLDLAAVDPQTLDICPFRMDRQIFKGIVWGITEQQKLTSLQQCFRDIHQIKKNMKDGLKLVAKLDFYDISEGLKEMAQAFDNVPTLQEDCGKSDGDLATLASWATIFLQPFTLVSDVKQNLHQHVAHLTMDAVHAKKQLANQEYFDFGVTLGEMLVILTSDPEASPTFEDFQK